jgi:hypothetical protein
MIQYAVTAIVTLDCRSVLDAPLEPVIGLTEGETRWRDMTRSGKNKSAGGITSGGSFSSMIWQFTPSCSPSPLRP